MHVSGYVVAVTEYATQEDYRQLASQVTSNINRSQNPTPSNYMYKYK